MLKQNKSAFYRLIFFHRLVGLIRKISESIQIELLSRNREPGTQDRDETRKGQKFRRKHFGFFGPNKKIRTRFRRRRSFSTVGVGFDRFLFYRFPVSPSSELTRQLFRLADASKRIRVSRNFSGLRVG